MRTVKFSRFGAKAGTGAVFALLALGLSACVDTGDKYAVIPCPYAGVLDDASEITRFSYGGDRDISDVEIHGEIERVDFSCRMSENKKVVIAKATVYTSFDKGLAAVSDRHFFQLFMARSTGEEKVVEKKQYTVTVDFKEGERRTEARTVIKGLRMPVEGEVSPEFQNVYFGFQLTPAEVAYNRTKN